jgi:hypothetical protein
MNSHSLRMVLTHMRQIGRPQAPAASPDADLLQRFAGEHDEAAFEELLRRHGPMVLLVWVHYSSPIVLYGAELTRTMMKRSGRQIRASGNAVFSEANDPGCPGPLAA